MSRCSIRKAASARRHSRCILPASWARRDKRVTLIDADPQGSALDWSEQRSARGPAGAFGVVGMARDTLHREAPAHRPPRRSCRHRRVPPRRPDAIGLARLRPRPAAGAAVAVRWLGVGRDADAASMRRGSTAASSSRALCSTAALRAPSSPARPPQRSPITIRRARQRIGQRVVFADAAKTGRLVWEIGTANQPPATPTDSLTKSRGSGDDDSHRRQSHERGR